MKEKHKFYYDDSYVLNFTGLINAMKNGEEIINIDGEYYFFKG